MARGDRLVKLHSLLGVVPLGAFLVFHIHQQWPALWSREHWVQRAMETRDRQLQLWLVVVPLGLHALLGILRAFRTRGRGHEAAGPRGLWVLQVITGIGAGAFIVAHLWHVWSWDTGAHTSAFTTYDTLLRDLGDPVVMVGYVVGMSAVYFHFGHGLSRAAVTWGVASSVRAVRRVRVLAGAVGFVLWVLTLQIVANFTVGDGVVPTGRDTLPGLMGPIDE